MLATYFRANPEQIDQSFAANEPKIMAAIEQVRL